METRRLLETRRLFQQSANTPQHLMETRRSLEDLRYDYYYYSCCSMLYSSSTTVLLKPLLSVTIRLLLLCVISLVNLEVLELRDNLIRFLPASLGSLTRLQSLDLGSNLIDILVRDRVLRHCRVLV